MKRLLGNNITCTPATNGGGTGPTRNNSLNHTTDDKATGHLSGELFSNLGGGVMYRWEYKGTPSLCENRARPRLQTRGEGLAQLWEGVLTANCGQPYILPVERGKPLPLGYNPDRPVHINGAVVFSVQRIRSLNQWVRSASNGEAAHWASGPLPLQPLKGDRPYPARRELHGDMPEIQQRAVHGCGWLQVPTCLSEMLQHEAYCPGMPHYKGEDNRHDSSGPEEALRGRSQHLSLISSRVACVFINGCLSII